MIVSTALVLADPSGEGAKAGPWGLAVILVLCVACYFLFKSMSKHLKRVRENFPAPDAPPAASPSSVRPKTGQSRDGTAAPGSDSAAAPGSDRPADGPSA